MERTRLLVAMRLQIGPAVVDVEVASTPEQLSRGLGGHAPLAPGHGMLFVFAQADRHAFWMRGVTFPIDVVFIALDGRVIEIVSGAVPQSEVLFTPHVPVQFVVELPNGFARASGIRIGSPVAALTGSLVR
jgi:uncharacterized protein